MDIMDILNIKQQVPSQESTLDQLKAAYQVCNRLGLYDAADVIRSMIEKMEDAAARYQWGE